eukprot:TRINITY_DN7995_c0_g1_i1.p1 TRINITY_DN7995_c0_g1~~TRINITY_DN7995_c0_g1_i1.p1  ORF type:complete len:340 (-),score=39.50 TRINITY_DN7995_c0_g1_i1:168-1100(-)
MSGVHDYVPQYRSPPAVHKSTVRLGLCQMLVQEDKKNNIEVAEKSIRSAASQGADLIVLPEMWNCPYSNSSFPIYAEQIPEEGDFDQDKSPSSNMMQRVSGELGVVLVGGSIPERTHQQQLFNTCCVFDQRGKLLAKHQKLHLFDIDIPGKITFKESDTLTAGTKGTVVDTDIGRIGVGICYDIRFPELSMTYAQQGVHLICFPGAFNMTTGPAHWKLLQQCRAVDNQIYVCSCSPARNAESEYQAWGHSMVVNPFAEVLAEAGHENEVLIVDIDLEQIQIKRNNMPLQNQKRYDLYAIINKQQDGMKAV